MGKYNHSSHLDDFGYIQCGNCYNIFFVADVRQFMADDILTVLANVGSQVFGKSGMLKFYPLVYM